MKAAGITAVNSSGVITYWMRGSDTYNPYTTTVTATVANGSHERVAFYPGTTTGSGVSATATGRYTAYDIYYTPSYATGVSASPGIGGTAGGTGRAGAAVIIW